MKARPPAEVAALLAPYLDAVGPCDDDGRPASYPGSPALAQSAAQAAGPPRAVRSAPGGARRADRGARARPPAVSIVATDGYVALNAYVPPKERRGLVLIDPPFEEPDESARVEAALARALAKWPRGIYALWRPIKAPIEDARFLNAIAALGAPEHAAARTRRRRRRARRRIRRTRCSRAGLLIVNPPFELIAEARVLMPWLAQALKRAGGRRVRLPMADAAGVGPAARGDVRRPPDANARLTGFEKSFQFDAPTRNAAREFHVRS